MTDLANAAIAASVIVGMLSIPAASQSVEPVEGPQDSLSNISMSDEVPVQESTEMSSDSFVREVESAFSSFRTEISSGEIEGKLENPDTSLEVESSPGETEWVLTSSEGRLVVKENAESVTETVSTPHGTLQKVKKNGGIKTSFEGSGREKVEEIREKLREKMRQRKKEYQEKADQARVEQYSEVDLRVEPETPEKVVVVNGMNRELDLSGWKVENSESDSHSLEAEIEPGQKLHVYSNNYAEKSEVEENDEDIYIYNTGISWPDSGGEAVLYDDREAEIESRAY